MKPFEYASPSTVGEAVELLAGGPRAAAVLAGGTDLLSLMKDRVETPPLVVGLGGIAELRALEHRPGSGVRIGAAVTLGRLLDDPAIARDYAAVHQAAEGVRSAQIRNVGTLGGDLCQRPRCWYYRNGFGLLGMRDGKSMIPDGDHRYHAVLGNEGPAYFVSPSSLAPPLIALGATVTLAGPDGERRMPLESFFRIPQGQDEREHALGPAEIVTGVDVPHPGRRRSATYEVRPREGLDWPLAAAAAVLELDAGMVRAAAVVLGHVAPVPWPAAGVNRELAGKPLDAAAAARAADAAVNGARSLGHNAYKIRLARAAARRAILRAAGMEV